MLSRTAPRSTAFQPSSLGLRPLLLIVLLSLLVTGCGLLPGGGTPDGPLQGRITTADGGALPPGSELEVFLQEETEADVIGPVVAHQRRTLEGPPPWSFRLQGKDPLNPRRLHVLRARILSDGRILYEKTAPVPVMTLGHPSQVQLELQRPPED